MDVVVYTTILHYNWLSPSAAPSPLSLSISLLFGQYPLFLLLLPLLLYHLQERLTKKKGQKGVSIFSPPFFPLGHACIVVVEGTREPTPLRSSSPLCTSPCITITTAITHEGGEWPLFSCARCHHSGAPGKWLSCEEIRGDSRHVRAPTENEKGAARSRFLTAI